ncbi:hypothetical protein AB0G04_44105 [Actinoplanes sp. NPDC023801]|uniref:hypothetical protein n=1 Tax=Actinoplanes sp. NPDC023801 TaxID=3154595 RepID=UPI0033C91BF1
MVKSDQVTEVQDDAADAANLAEVPHALGWFYCCTESNGVLGAVNVATAAAVGVRVSTRNSEGFGVWVEKPSGAVVELMLGPYPDVDYARGVMTAVLDHAVNNIRR